MVLTNLFKLDGTPQIHQPGDAPPAMSPGDTLKNIEFRHGLWPSNLRKIRGVTFNSVGLSKAVIERTTFTDCIFEDCLFLGSQFREVEFHNCSFQDCNFWKAKFEKCYLDPDRIVMSNRFKIEAANAGISIFQALLGNFADERQDEFYMRADIRFRQWKRYQLAHDLRRRRIGWWAAKRRHWSSLAYELLSGFGYRPGRFFLVTLILFVSVSTINYVVIGTDIRTDGVNSEHASFVDALFYFFSVLTVLGFSVVVPTTATSKLLTVLEALAAVGWLGIFTSVLVKRFLR